MEARDWRLLKMFALNVAGMLAFIVGLVGYMLLLWWLPDPWGMVLGFCVPVAFFLKLSWDMAKSRLERQEMLEKRLADQLASMD
jgi:cyanate permease